MEGEWSTASVSEHGLVAVASADVVLLRATGVSPRRVKKLLGEAAPKKGELLPIRLASVSTFFGSGDVLAIGGYPTLMILDASGDEIRVLASFDLPSEPCALAPHPNGGVLGFCKSGVAFRYGDRGAWELRPTLLADVSIIAFAPSGDHIVVASNKHRRVYLLDAELKELCIEAYPYSIEDIRWRSDGQVLIADAFGNVACYVAP